MSINAVFDSWNNNRAISYRNLNDIPHNLGTAVNIQTWFLEIWAMIQEQVLHLPGIPSTGENKQYGEYLINAQGEDVVAGIRTPQTIDNLKK